MFYFLSQPLGVWSKSIFRISEEVGAFKNISPIDDRLNISNDVFNSFKDKTGKGKDYYIKGTRELKNNFINSINTYDNYVEYK